jgi:hypothetical protein
LGASEWTNLRRIKLEALMKKMHRCRAFLNGQRRKALDGEPEVQERDKWGELDSIGTLYFRELEIKSHVIKCVQQGRLNIQLWREVRSAMNETDPIGWPNLDRELQAAHDEVTAAARSLLEQIDRMRPPPCQNAQAPSISMLEPNAYAAHRGRYEPGETCNGPGSNIPAGAEVREGREPNGVQ